MRSRKPFGTTTGVGMRMKALITAPVLLLGLAASFSNSIPGGALTSAAAATGDTCGYPTGTTGKPATVFNENTLASLIQVNGTGLSSTVSAFSTDENSILLGVTDPNSSATVTPFYPTASLASALQANVNYASIKVTNLSFSITSGQHLQIGPSATQVTVQASASVAAAGGTVTIPVNTFHVDSNHLQSVGSPVVDLDADKNVVTEHASNPSLGDTTLLDPSGRPQYPAIFVTNLSADGAGSMAGDWQQGGTAQANVNDVFGTWVTGSFVNVNGVLTYQKPAAPAQQNNFNFGPGSDTPQSSLGQSQGYGTETRWNVSSLVDDHGQPLISGNNYRFQVLLHDGDQNKTGGDAGELCTTLTVPGGNLDGHIYQCNNGSQTTTEVPGGTITTTISGSSASQSNPAAFNNLTPGQYPAGATAPAGYELVTCGSTLYTVGGGGGTASYTNTLTVPNNGTATANFYVIPIPGTLVGNIYDCTNGAQTTNQEPGGTIATTINGSSASQNNPATFSNLAPGGYPASATAPANFEFVTCGSNLYTVGNNGGTAAFTNNVTVPSNGTGTANFYVIPIPGSLVGNIFDCANGVQTTTQESGGTITTTISGSSASQSNPALFSNLTPGGYPASASAPANFEFVSCGSNLYTVSNNGATATFTNNVTVPANGTGTANFYVIPIPGTLVGNIFLCSNGAPTTTQQTGGTVTTTINGSSASQPNPASFTNLTPGGYPAGATAPANFEFVSCGTSNYSIGNGGGTATYTSNVNVPANGTGTANFYVVPIPGTLLGNIYDCTNGVQTTNQETGGTITTTINGSSASQPNPASFGNLTPGGYPVSATAPTNFEFVTCGSNLYTVGSGGSSATFTNNVNVPANGSATANFYVIPIPGTLVGNIYLCNSGQQTTTEQPGGAIAASGPSGNLSGNDTGNGVTFMNLTPGGYSVSATAPTNFEFVTCGSNNYTVGNSGGSAAYNNNVNVPANGTGSAQFYVIPIPGTLVGNIFDCTNGVQTTTQEPGGTITTTINGSPASQSNPATFSNLTPGGYPAGATAPTGFEFVSCGSSNYTISNSGGSAAYNSNVNVPANGTGTANFYVVRIPATTVYIQTLDSCRYAVGGGSFALFNSLGNQVATGTGAAGANTVVSHASGCPAQNGNCITVPVGCLSFTLTAPSSGTATYTVKETAAPSGYVPCNGGSACQVAIMTITIDSSGNVKATLANTDPDGFVQKLPTSDPNNGGAAFWSASKGDPALFYNEHLGTISCDGDNDADDHNGAGPGGHCEQQGDVP